MSFNQYTWDLYKQTTIGIEMIKYFSDAGGYVLFKDYCPYANFIPEDLYNDWLENIYCYGVSDYDHPSSLEEAKDLYISLITLGIRVEGQQWLPANDFKNMLGIIQPMSYVLSQFAPEYFFPYLFLCRILITKEGACIIGNFARCFICSEKKMDYLQQIYGLSYTTSHPIISQARK